MPALFPIHVLDRELDYTIFFAVLASIKGEICIFGDEHNIGPLYKSLDHVKLIRHGSPTKDPTRRSWNRSVVNNGGSVYHFNVEGNNNLPFKLVKKSNDNRYYVKPVDPKSYEPYGANFSILDYKEQNTRIYFQSQYQQDIHNLRCPFYKSLPLNQLEISGDPRDILYSDIGKSYFQSRTKSLRRFIGSPYILVSDNFNVDSFGHNKKGILDPRPGLISMGASKEEADIYYSQMQDSRNNESKARDAFATLLEHLIKRFPNIVFVLRPHPVMDGNYWYERLTGYRNLVIVYRDSVYPWIHGCSCLLHTGCTTGYESVRSGIPAFDVSYLINKKTYSLSQFCSQQPKDMSSLESLIKNIMYSSNLSNTIDSDNLKLDLSSNIFSDNCQYLFSTLADYIDQSYKKVINQFTHLSNAAYLFENDFLIGRILNDIEPASNEDYSSVMRIASMHCANNAPIMNKSRYLDFNEIFKRIQECFSIFGIEASSYGFEQISQNTYILSLKDRQIQGTSSNLSTPVNNSIQYDKASKALKKSISNVWPQTVSSQLQKSSSIYSFISRNLRALDLPSCNVKELLQYKKSDTLFIFGGGKSINTITDHEFFKISQHDSIGLSNFIAHKFDCTYYLYEACSDWHVDFLSTIRQSTASSSPILLNARHSFELSSSNIDKIKSLGLSFFNSRLLKLTNQTVFTDCLQNILELGSDMSVFHARGSLSIAYSLAVALGYESIVLCGIELDSNDYFYEFENAQIKSPQVYESVRECMKLEKENSNKSGYNVKGMHLTVDKSASNTLDMVSIITNTAKVAKTKFNVNTYLYKKIGLLKSSLPTYT